MTAPDWKALLDLPWLSWSIGGLVALTGFILLYRALFADRPRGRRRCPKCWYDMRGTPSLRCPECGHTPKSERRLHRTRRYWRWGALATLCIVGGVALAIVPQVRRDGWMSIVPTTALLTSGTRGWNYYPSWRDDPVANELAERNAAATLYGWQWSYVMDNLVDLKHRRTWPASVPYVVELRLPGWLACTSESTIRRTGDLESRHGGVTKLSARHFSLGYLDAGKETQFVCTFMNERQGMPLSLRPSACRGPWMHELTRKLHVRVVENIDDAITPLSGPAIDAAVRKAISLHISPDLSCVNNMGTASLRLELLAPFDSHLSTLGRGFTLELHAGDKTLDSAALVYEERPPMIHLGSMRSLDNIIFSSTKYHIDFFRKRSDWHFILRGNPELALRDWDKTAYWDGQITLVPDEVWIEGRDPIQDLHKPLPAKSP